MRASMSFAAGCAACVCLGLRPQTARGYEVWLGTHLMQSSVATSLDDWDLTASLLDGTLVNRAPHDTNPASNNNWRTIFNTLDTPLNRTSTIEVARSSISRNTSIVGEAAFGAIGRELEERFELADRFGYEIDQFMFYDNALGPDNYSWTAAEAGHMRSWLDDNGYSDIELVWNARNFGPANQNWARNPIVDHVMIEGSADDFIRDQNRKTTLLNWLWTHPDTVNKDVILQIPRSENSMSQYAATRRVAVSLADEIGYVDGLQSDRLVFSIVTYNDNAPYLAETNASGTRYESTLTGLALSLLEQRSNFEGRDGFIATNAFADSFERRLPEPLDPNDYRTLVAGWETWSEVAADTWDATQANGLLAQAAATPEEGGQWANFNNATVENGASSDGRYGDIGPTGANASVADATDGVMLANGFDGFIDFTLTDTSGDTRELTGFHFDIGAFRGDAATNWELEVLPRGDISAGSVASGSAPVNAGPIQGDETVDLSDLVDNTLEGYGAVTFRLHLIGGGGDAGAIAGGHHLFLDNVGVSGVTLRLAGDYNEDSVVDAADYVVWREAVGQSAGSLPNDSSGEPIGEDQYQTWLANYGRTLPRPNAVSTPEPGATVPVLAILLTRLALRSRSGCEVWG